VQASPPFSIIIPTYHREAQLIDLLLSLTRLRYEPSRFEVILVDDGGRSSPDAVVKPFCTRLNLALIKQENSGPAMARNHAARRAGGRFLAFTDDDCLVDPGWLKALAEGFEQAPVSICGGRTVNALTRNPYSVASHLLLDFLHHHYSPRNCLGGFFPTNNFAVQKANFLEMGGFDPSLRFGEDRDFCHRWASRGYLFQNIPDAVIYHAHALDFSSFLRLHFSYGGGTYEFRKRCVQRGGVTARLNPPSFYLSLILSGIRREKNVQGLWGSMLLLLSQLANTAGFFWKAIGN
jgi:glycosyltransferase involved in cell wall biosynthesis